VRCHALNILIPSVWPPVHSVDVVPQGEEFFAEACADGAGRASNENFHPLSVAEIHGSPLRYSRAFAHHSHV